MKYLFIIPLLLISISGYTQRDHFIYIQADNKQPFYVKMNKKLLSSTASGYIIIPRLQDSSYKLSIGFPKNEWAEQQLTCNINQSDAGFLLKNFGEKGWGLFNLQSMALVMADTAVVTDIAVVKKENKPDVFAEMLSNVVNDPSIRNAQNKENVHADVKHPANKVTGNKKGVNDKKGNVKSKIAKISSKKNKDNVSLLYVDKSKGVNDTVNVLIPLAGNNIKKNDTIPGSYLVKEIVPVQVANDSVLNKDVANKEIVPVPNKITSDSVPPDTKKDEAVIIAPKTDSVVSIIPEVKKDEPVAITVKKDSVVTIQPEIKKEEPVVVIAKKDSVVTILPEIKKDEPVAVTTKTDSVIAIQPVVKKDEKTITPEPVIPKDQDIVKSKPLPGFALCKIIADGDEFLDLRKKMVKSSSDNEKLFHAHKAFLKKCFTTKFIERLSILFADDNGRYKFFDDAYQYVSDRENFPLLAEQLKDEYFINRFKAMLR